MGRTRSYFRHLRLIAQSDPETLIEVTLDVAPGPGVEAIPLLARGDGPSGERTLHARGYSDQSALEFSLRVRFTKEITGYTPTKVRRATATLLVPADKFLFYTSDEIRWTDVLQRPRIGARVQADLDIYGREIAVFEIPHEPDAIGLVIRHTLLEALDVAPQLTMIVINRPPNVPAVWQHEPSAKPVPVGDHHVREAFVTFVFAALLIIVTHLVDRI
jgi:hypothetical protein